MRGGLLQIGPESAGSDPGPACYGKGETRPTVTDANVVLGRINPERPIGGKLDAARCRGGAHGHRERTSPHRSASTLMAAAEAIVRVANSRMAGAIRLVSIERGHDPQALRADAVRRRRRAARRRADEGSRPRTRRWCRAIPASPRRSAASSPTCATISCRRSTGRSMRSTSTALNAAIGEMTGQWPRRCSERAGDQARAATRRASSSTCPISARRTPSRCRSTSRDGALTVRRDPATAFDAAYRAAFGRLLDGIPVRVLTLRVAVIGRRPKFDLAMLATRARGRSARPSRGRAPVWFDGKAHATRDLRPPVPAGRRRDRRVRRSSSSPTPPPGSIPT